MRGPKINEFVFELVKPIAEERGLEIVAVEYVKEGGNWFLRIYIDKEGGIELEDCQEISREVSNILDKKDPIPQSYFLEVSSPGIERLLQTEKDFVKFRGTNVVVHTYVPFEGQKKIKGALGIADDEVIEIFCDEEKVIRVPREKVSQVRLAWEEEEGRSKK